MDNITVKDVSEDKIGKEFYLLAQIRAIRQTSGPTVFELKDNTGTIKSTAFTRAGERAFPTLVAGNNIQAKVAVKKRGADLELEILGYEKINQEIIDNSAFEKRQFLVKSERMDKLRPLFLDAAKQIMKAIDSSRPIVIRHHDDVDGYTCGLVLEKAIRPLIEEINPEKPYLFISRTSSRTPFYDYIDALRDLNDYLSAKEKYDEPAPLIILCDLGSNGQSIKAIKRLMMYEIDFIIIDHHHFDEDNKKSAKVFLNPHAFGMGSEINAGALCTELALIMNPGLKIRHLPALSGVADRSTGEEFEQYLKLSGYDKPYLEKWSRAIDHDLNFLRFNECSALLEDLFFPTENNKKIIEDIDTAMEGEFSAVKNAVSKYLKITEFGRFKLLRIARNTVPYGSYAGSKLPRIANDSVTGPRITMVEEEDSVSFRVDGVKEFSVVKLVEMLKSKMPYAMIDGGGHDYAGTLKFSPAAKEEVMKEVEEYIKLLK
jgi:RecJ-like exonuclease